MSMNKCLVYYFIWNFFIGSVYDVWERICIMDKVESDKNGRNFLLFFKLVFFREKEWLW